MSHFFIVKEMALTAINGFLVSMLKGRSLLMALGAG